jgi:signal transduction histidine kinase/CheY-like chemotaxis protein/streptogramin lyase
MFHWRSTPLEHLGGKHWLASLALANLLFANAALAVNQVLVLDGDEAHLELPQNMFDGMEAATVELWLRFDATGHYATAWSFGQPWQTMCLSTFSTTTSLQFFIYDRHRDLHRITLPSVIVVGEWFHVAAVSGPGGMKLYVDGILAGTTDFRGSFKSIGDAVVNYIGKPHWKENAPFRGAMDEFRVWNCERTADEIRAGRFKTLTGREAGLIALWNFDEGTGRDATPFGHHGTLRGGARCEPAPALAEESTRRLVAVQGTVRDASGQPLSNARVQIRERDQLVAHTFSDDRGRYRLFQFATAAPCDLLAVHPPDLTALSRVQWLTNVVLSGQLPPLDFQLVSPLGIAGTLSGFDDSPHAAVCVELLRGDAVVGHTLSSPRGEYAFAGIKPGRYRVRCVHGGQHMMPVAKGIHDSTDAAFEVELRAGEWLTGVDFKFAPRNNKGSWRFYTSNQGLPSNRVTTVHNTPDGLIWIGTLGGGLARYDGNDFEVFDTEDGLSSNDIIDLASDAQGRLWISTAAGLNCFESGRFSNFGPSEHMTLDLIVAFGDKLFAAHERGLWRLENARCVPAPLIPAEHVYSMARADDESLWIGGNNWIGHLSPNGFRQESVRRFGMSGRVLAMLVDTRRRLWFSVERALVCIDQDKVRTFNLAHGLPEKEIHALFEDRSGNIWAGTEQGLAAFTGDGFLTFPWPERTPQGQFTTVGLTRLDVAKPLLPSRMRICQDDDGGVWVTSAVGLFRFDPTSVRSLTTADGLPGGSAVALAIRSDGMMAVATADFGLATIDTHQTFFSLDRVAEVRVVDRGSFALTGTYFDRLGDLWAAASSGNAQVYDGLTYQRKRGYAVADGLLSITTTCYWQHPEGELWIGTDAGVNRVQHQPQGPPRVSSLPETHNSPIRCIFGDSQGVMWIGTANRGIYRWDGNKGRFHGKHDLLPDNSVNAICESPDGNLWVGTERGLCRVSLHRGPFDQSPIRTETFTRRKGLPSDSILALHWSKRGDLWVGTAAGLARFDGEMWAVLDSRDGLAGNQVRGIAEDAAGRLWLACDGGVSCYTPNEKAPKAEITLVQADRAYSFPSVIPGVNAGARVTIHFRGVDMKTIPAKRQFRFRGAGVPGVLPQNWRSARASYFEFTPSQPGTYQFEVQAVDRDLNYSQPAMLQLNVVLPWHRTPTALAFAFTSLVALVCAVGAYGRKYYQQRRRAQELQKELLEKERSANQAKSLFLAKMSHDIRTPLNAILGYAQLLYRSETLPRETRQSVEIIRQSGTSLLSLINNILDLSRIEAGRQDLEKTDFDLVGLINSLSSILELSARQKGLDWRVEWRRTADHCPAQIPRLTVHGDEAKLRQVLINLLSNAVKFTETGSVTLRIVLPETNASRMHTDLNEAQTFVFEVADTGSGIDAATGESVFEPFARARTSQTKEGTGLGLAIAKRLITLLGGELSFTSTPGQGSCFRAVVPLTLAASAAEFTLGVARREVARIKGSAQVKILVVDDEPHNRDVLQKMLESVGATVQTASTGPETLAQVSASSPHLIFLDIWMPGMDGLETARCLRAQHQAACPRLVAYSASALVHERDQFLKGGFDDFLAKPATMERLCECLATHLHVEFEYRSEPAPAAFLSGISIPDALSKRVIAAAEIYNSSELMRCIDEIERLGPDEARMAHHIRGLAHRSAMCEITTLLSSLQSSSPSNGAGQVR